MPRPVRQSHRLAGSWAYDHGVAADLSRNASTRVNVLTIVSAIRQSVQACAADRGWPYLRLRELRVCAYLACEMHRRFRLRNCQLSPESSHISKGCGASPGMHVEWLRLRNHASLRRTTALIASAAAHPAAPRARGRHSLRAGHNGKAFGQAVSPRTRRTARGS